MSSKDERILSQINGLDYRVSSGNQGTLRKGTWTLLGPVHHTGYGTRRDVLGTLSDEEGIALARQMGAGDEALDRMREHRDDLRASRVKRVREAQAELRRAEDLARLERAEERRLALVIAAAELTA